MHINQSNIIQNNYSIAEDAINKIQAIIGNEDLEYKGEFLSNLKNRIKEMKEIEAESERQRKEIETKERNEKEIKRIISECRKTMSASWPEAKFQACIEEAVALDPGHPEIEAIMVEYKELLEKQKKIDSEKEH